MFQENYYLNFLSYRKMGTNINRVPEYWQGQSPRNRKQKARAIDAREKPARKNIRPPKQKKQQGYKKSWIGYKLHIDAAP